MSSLDFLFVILVASTLTGCSDGYNSGSKYSFSYQTSTTVNDLVKAGENVGVKLESKFDLTVVWQHDKLTLFKLQVTDAVFHQSAHSDGKSFTYLPLTRYPTYFSRKDGLINRVYSPSQDSVNVRNIKNGMISLFQYQHDEGMYTEVDVSGQCDVDYKVTGSTVIKSKVFCESLEIAGQFTSFNKILDSTKETSCVTIYQLSGDVLQEATSIETHKKTLNIYDKLGTNITQRQHLKLETFQGGQGTVHGATPTEALKSCTDENLIESLLTSEDEAKTCRGDSCVKPAKLVEKLREVILNDNPGQLNTASSFLQIQSSFKHANEKSILSILNDPENYDIIGELIDACAASQGSGALHAVMEYLKFEDVDFAEISERFFFDLSFLTHPSEDMIRRVMELVQNEVGRERIRYAAALSLGAMVNTYSVEAGLDAPVVSEVKTILLNKVKACPDDKCRIRYLGALGNTRLAHNMPFLIEIARDAEHKSVSLAALHAISKLEKTLFTKEILSVLEEIFHCNKKTYDSTVRSSALSILLNHDLSTAQLLNLLLTSTEKSDFEFSKFVFNKIKDTANQNDRLRDKVSAILDDSKLTNYYTLAQRGFSNSHGGTLGSMSNGTTAYSLSLQCGFAGVIKQSEMSVTVKQDKDELPILLFGMYADGLESMLGSESSSEETVEAVAGMTIDLLGVTLQPVEFFHGQSGLMSAVWNAPTSPTSALQGNVLIHDHIQHIHLQNGFIVDSKLQSAFSLDISGAITISLWNRNSESIVRNSGAIYIRSETMISNPAFTLGEDVIASTESYIDVNTDLDFSNMPIKMCLQMSRPDFDFAHNITKYSKIASTRRGHTIKSRRVFHVNAASFRFHKENANQCRALLLGIGS